MRREVIICDICGKEINKGDARIKAKIREFDSWANDMLWESQKWKKLDICTHCLNEMSIYIKSKGRCRMSRLKNPTLRNRTEELCEHANNFDETFQSC